MVRDAQQTFSAFTLGHNFRICVFRPPSQQPAEQEWTKKHEKLQKMAQIVDGRCCFRVVSGRDSIKLGGVHDHKSTAMRCGTDVVV